MHLALLYGGYSLSRFRPLLRLGNLPFVSLTHDLLLSRILLGYAVVIQSFRTFIVLGSSGGDGSAHPGVAGDLKISFQPAPTVRLGPSFFIFFFLNMLQRSGLCRLGQQLCGNPDELLEHNTLKII